MNQEQPHTTSVEHAATPEKQEQLKTIAIRVEESLHAQLRFISQLSGTTITDEIRTAIEQRINAAQTDPEIIAKAAEARVEIEREAAARAAAIAGFMGAPAVAATIKAPTEGRPRPRRSTKGDDQ
ncbi:hypothetical protein HWD35_18945 [Tsukamurella tyrosinosolvens]|uniref:hypothetical protein n=1 Tax=Tsukamurella tyrosinosolvens TaxID=57704 RepID=UPI001CE11F2A|nr:hypothetical protein [Tsukamurella tyrosinosolvens]MCA4996797.1 hypothetical protein [Tsukamurella tyrosinosolvens]